MPVVAMLTRCFILAIVQLLFMEHGVGVCMLTVHSRCVAQVKSHGDSLAAAAAGD